ncbi:phosphopentomutase [Halarsenatibacter silvermanii]|uniref:Phosphopentomutase n=1 Tax=Halarsenatibacter silvermanii TaxID=321763 RepID=A0A1G9PJP6_9FIRM|nr:phosphopentomutase [Halarsenatibacter silvermanii]SDL98721.1 phosphopentomutase [Halarsenatibacter silvermanii]
MAEKIDRTIIIVLDSVGIGALPDADQYGDAGADTLGNLARAVGGLDLPGLSQLGLGRVKPVPYLDDNISARGVFGRMAEASVGKDTTTGHWELAGLISERPFPTYPDGFPEEVIKLFKEAIGRDILGNKPASGTVIIEELAEEHLATGRPIVYTSADSVFQIAAHEDIIPVEKLYEMCEKAREILTGEHGVARVIARPFVGEPGELERTDRRKDFSLPPPGKTLLNSFVQAHKEVVGIGKIIDIFAGDGVTESDHTINNIKCTEAVIDYMDEVDSGLIFANLVEFDMLYGHRRDPEGYYQALKDFDERLPDILARLKSNDMLVITADHGCDPTYEGTDHTREFLPLLLAGEKLKANYDLGTRSSFADMAATIADLHGLPAPEDGRSFAGEILS